MNDFFKQPKDYWGLLILATVLMFGYSFYQGTTVLYLINNYKLSTANSYQISGTFAALVYFSAVFSGYFTNRMLDARKGIKTGLALAVLGLGLTALNRLHIYYFGMACFAVGYGFIYTNTFFLLGLIYPKGDGRREGGFTLAYMGFNVGSLAGFSLGGLAIQLHVFTTSSLLVGGIFLIVLLLSAKLVDRIKIETRQYHNKYMSWQGLSVFFYIIMVWAMINWSSSLQWLLFSFCVIILLGVFGLAIKVGRVNKENGRNLLLLGFLTLSSIIYWTIYKLQDEFLLYYFQNHVARIVDGITIPSPTLLSINPITILLFGALINWFWIKTGDKYNTPLNKVVAGLLLLSIAFIPLIWGTSLGVPVGLGWVIMFLIVLSLSELVFGPGTMSMVGQLSEEKYQGIMLGVVQLSTSLASIFAAQFSIVLQQKYLNNMKTLQIGYIHAFLWVVGVLIIGALITIVIKRRVK